MNATLVSQLFRELQKLPILDPHTHVRADQPVAKHLGDLLGYHYYTELANSSRGTPVKLPDDPQARIDYVWPHLPQLRGTVQFDWMMGISEILLGIPRADWWTQPKETIVKRAQQVIESKSYASLVWEKSNLTQAYMTNLFDEDLSKHADARLVPCLRTDDLVFHLVKHKTLPRLEKASGIKVGESLDRFNEGLSKIFARYAGWKMGYAALGLPPNYIQAGEVSRSQAELVHGRLAAGEHLSEEQRYAWAAYMLDRIAAECARVKAPFVVMVGADREVYPQGVPAGQDLFRCDSHLRGLDGLFNKYADVRFPVMVVSDTAGLELAAQGWIRHNVFVFSHWWYANNPEDIRREVRRRLDVLPRNKMIGFHSDGYSSEFILPKFNTYRLVLAKVLAEKIEESQVAGSSVTEPLDAKAALDLAERILIQNPKALFGIR